MSLLKALQPESVRRARALLRGYRNAFGTYPNLLFPRTFSDKIQHRKLFDRNPLFPRLADKVLAKEYVSERIGSDYVIPTLWSGTHLPPSSERGWSTPFVLKANHGSGWNAFVRGEPDWPDLEQQASLWMSNQYGDWGGEWLYSKIKPRLLIEPFVTSDTQFPIDYKLWVFAGQVHYIQVDTDREHAHKRVFFDRDWNRLPFLLDCPADDRPIPRPASLDQMIAFGERLGGSLEFVRVDFYEIGGQPLFGEMTFYPGSGYQLFEPRRTDRDIGSLWV